jgi:hypothetical protein
MKLRSDNSPQEIFDKHYALKCPHCGVQSNISAVSIPRYEYLARFVPERVGIVYRCDSCNEPIFLRFTLQPDFANGRADILETYEEVEHAQETFEFKYLPDELQQDFREALTCYSSLAYNGFAAMCRRTIQSACTDLGAEGSDKILNQLKELKEIAQIDDEAFVILKQIVIDGHDGTHPHLPKLNPQRAGLLLELMKDVLYQLYVRKGKLKESMELRQAAILKKTQ